MPRVAGRGEGLALPLRAAWPAQDAELEGRLERRPERGSAVLLG